MRTLLQYTVLTLLAFGSSLQASDNKTHTTSNTKRNSAIVPGCPDEPFKLNEKAAFQQIKHNLYGSDDTLSDEETKRVNTYIKFFNQMQSIWKENLDRVNAFADSRNINVQRDCFVPDEYMLMKEIHGNRIPFKTHGEVHNLIDRHQKLCNIFCTWRDQGLQNVRSQVK